MSLNTSTRCRDKSLRCKSTPGDFLWCEWNVLQNKRSHRTIKWADFFFFFVLWLSELSIFGSFPNFRVLSFRIHLETLDCAFFSSSVELQNAVCRRNTCIFEKKAGSIPLPVTFPCRRGGWTCRWQGNRNLFSQDARYSPPHLFLFMESKNLGTFTAPHQQDPQLSLMYGGWRGGWIVTLDILRRGWGESWHAHTHTVAVPFFQPEKVVFWWKF